MVANVVRRDVGARRRDPRPRVVLVAGVLGHAVHGKGVERLEEQRADAPGEHRRVGVHPPDRVTWGEPALALRAPDPLRGLLPVWPGDLVAQGAGQAAAYGSGDHVPSIAGRWSDHLRTPPRTDRAPSEGAPCSPVWWGCWIVPTTWASVSGCEPSDDSPSVPSCPSRCAAARRAGHQPALVLAPRDAGPLRGRRRRRVGVHAATTRCGCSGAVSPARLDELAADKRFLRRLRAGRAPTSSTTSPATAGTSAAAGQTAAARDRLLLPGVRHHRGAAAVLRRPRHPGRRPPQDRQRPRRPDHRRRAALPARLLPPVAVPRRLAAGDLPGPRPRRAADRAAARGRRLGGARSPSALPGDAAAAWPASGSPRSAGCRCCCSTPTSRRTRRSLREVTDRLYGGNTEHRLRQEMLLGIGGVRALRAYSPDHRRPGARGVPHQRGPRRLPRPRADPRAHRGRRRPDLDFDAALEVSRAGTVFTTHTPVPAGIDRFPRDLIAQYFGGDNACARRPASSGSWRSAPRTSTAATRRCSTWR